MALPWYRHMWDISLMKARYGEIWVIYIQCGPDKGWYGWDVWWGCTLFVMTHISEHTYIWFMFLCYGPYINRYGRHVLLMGQMYFILAHIVRYGWFFLYWPDICIYGMDGIFFSYAIFIKELNFFSHSAWSLNLCQSNDNFNSFKC